MTNEFLEIAKRIRDLVRKLPNDVGQMVVNYSLEAFRKEEMEGNKWQPLKDGSSDGDRTTRRGMLIKSGALRRSIRVISISSGKVVVGSDLKYAQIQNEGGTSHPRVTEKSRKYFWSLYEKTGNPKYKAMALTAKNAFTVNIPARPFLKLTPELKARIEKEIETRIRLAYKF